MKDSDVNYKNLYKFNYNAINYFSELEYVK